jgi:hypothetical protein
MSKIIVSLTVAIIVLAGCTTGSDESRTATSSRERPTQGSGSPRIPYIQGADLAKAVKRLHDEGLFVDMSSLSVVERRYGRQLLKGYYQSHPRAVVVDYELTGSKIVSIKQVDCPPKLEAC